MVAYNNFSTLPVCADTDVQAMASRIEAIFNAGTPELVAAGSRWYAERHQELKDISLMTGIPVDVLAYVASALSPQTRWANNRTALFQTLDGFINGNGTPVRSATLYAANDAKAFAMLCAWQNGADIETIAALIGKGLKTTCFAPNLQEQETIPYGKHKGKLAGTVDSISYQAATGFVPTRGIVGNRYWRVLEAFRIVAHKYGLPVYILQAVVWCIYRGTGN